MIPFVDLGAQYRAMQPELEESVLRVMRSGQYILGPEVEALEKELADFAGVSHCVSCASGTDALVIALMAKGVGPGDAVFTSPFTFMASAEAIALVGATPVFVDIDETTFNISPPKLRLAIEAVSRTGDLIPRGIIPVDLFGLPADYPAIQRIADEFELFVIEDAAQSFGASLDNRRTGALAEIACTSFFPAKPLGAYGDGGALFCGEEALDGLFRSIRVHGQGNDRYEHVRLGITGRLDAIQAAILRVKLREFEKEVAERNRVARSYDRLIRHHGVDVRVPHVPEGMSSAWAQYSVLARDGEVRKSMQARLAEKAIPTAIYYPKPLHLQPAFIHLGYATGDMPVSEDCGSRIFSLPMHPYLDDDTIATIVEAMAV